MRLINIIILSFGILFTGCVNQERYIEPVDIKNSAKLFVKKEELLSNYAFPLEIKIQLDNKIIDEYDYPEMIVFVSKGKHELILDISAFYHGYRVKYNITKKYSIDFEPNQTYFISAKIEEERLVEENENVEAYYSIKSKNINIHNKIVLEDDFHKTHYGGNSKTSRQVTTGILGGAIGGAIEAVLSK